MDERAALGHDLHVGVDNCLTELAEFFDVLGADHLFEMVFGDVEVLEKRRDLEERAEEAVALHAQLKIGPVGGFFSDIESGSKDV